MDYCCATLKSIPHLATVGKSVFSGEENGFWVEKIKGSSNNCARVYRFGKKLNLGKREKKIRTGVAYSVLTTENTNETLRIPVPRFERSRANPKNVATIILGGGGGEHLFPLTSRAARRYVLVGGCYRLIDIPMSNCINGSINKIFVLTQFNSASLNRHIFRTYTGNSLSFGDGYVEVLAATQTAGETGNRWFQAVRQFIWLFEDLKAKDIDNILILSGDHLYRMDYMDFIQSHIDRDADITLSCAPVDDRRASALGLVKIDSRGRAYIFWDYWEDIGTVKSFYDANLALTDEFPKFGFYDPKTPFYTSPRFLPPTKIDNCKIKDAIVSHGCFLHGCIVEHFVVGERSRIDSGVELKQLHHRQECKNWEGDVVIKNKDGVEEGDRPNEGFYIRSGITMIAEKATINDGTII